MNIAEYSNLSDLEKKLKFLKVAGRMSTIADYNLSFEDQAALTEMIRTALYAVSETPGYQAYRGLFDRYPFSCLTQMVNQIIFGETDEFWQPWADSLDIYIDGNTQSRIGQLATAAIQNLDFYFDDDLSDQHVAGKYVRPLTSLSGIPNYALDKLFDIVVGYPHQYFDPETIRSELISWKSYMINRVTERYFKKYPNESVKLLLNIYDWIQSASPDRQTSSIDRIEMEFRKWWETESEHTNERQRRQKEMPLPILCFSETGAGVCLQLPSVQSKNEYSEALRWTVMLDSGACFDRTEKLIKRGSGLQTKERVIAVAPSESYTISLYNMPGNEKLIDACRIPCLNGNCYLLFDKNGRKVNEPYLPDSFGYLVVRKGTKVEFRDLSHDELALPEISDDYRAFCFSHDNNSARIFLNATEVVIKPRASVHAGLIGSSYLFGQKPTRNMLPLFTVKPTLCIEASEVTGEELSVQIKHLQSGRSVTRKIDESESLIDLENSVSCFGAYDIRFYADTRFLKRLSFGYVPEVPYCDEIVPLPQRNGFTIKSGFRFDSSAAKVTVLSHYTTVSDYVAKKGWKSAWVEGGEPLVRGQLSCDCGGSEQTFEWEKTVHALSWMIWSEDGDDFEYCARTFSTTLDKHAELWLSLWLDSDILAREPAPSLTLRSPDGSVMQRNDVHCRINGAFNLSLRIFTDTLSQAVLPVTITLEAGGREISLVRVTDTIELPALRYSISKKYEGKAILSWEESGSNVRDSAVVYGITNPDFTFPLTLKQRTIREDRMQILISSDLFPAGIYKIGLPSEQEDLFDEYCGWKPQVINSSNIFVVNAKELWANHGDLDSLLRALMLASFSKDKLMLIGEIQREYCKTQSFSPVITDDTPKLLASLLLSHREVVNEAPEAILNTIDQINRVYLTGEMRMQITKGLLEYDLSVDEQKFCFRQLNLFLSHSKACDLSSDAIRKIGVFNEELELLWMLRNRITQGLLQKIKLVVGSDVLRESIRFSNESDMKGTSWNQLLENLFEGERTAAVFVPNEKICGNSESFYSMIEYGEGYQAPRIDFGKRPTDGVYFCGQTYCDILAAWWLRYENSRETMEKPVEQLKQWYWKIENIAKELKRSGPQYVRAYLCVLESRDIGVNGGTFSFCYTCAIATLADSLYNHGMLDADSYTPVSAFLMEMMGVFPDLVKRDLLLAELMMYINRGDN